MLKWFHWNIILFFDVFIFPRLTLRGGWGCAQVWTPVMMAILKGPNCHTVTEDCTQEQPAPQLQDPTIPLMGLAVAEVNDTKLAKVSNCCPEGHNPVSNPYPVDLMWGTLVKIWHNSHCIHFSTVHRHRDTAPQRQFKGLEKTNM